MAEVEQIEPDFGLSEANQGLEDIDGESGVQNGGQGTATSPLVSAQPIGLGWLAAL